MSELKPCPFCGNETIYDVAIETNRAAVRCTKCGHGINGAPPEAVYKLWNTRPIEDALRAELAQARDALKQIRELAKYDLDHEEDGNTYQIEAIANSVIREQEGK